jgi:hypothetical protein
LYGVSLGAVPSSFAIEFLGVTFGLAETVPEPGAGKDVPALIATPTGILADILLLGLRRADMIAE